MRRILLAILLMSLASYATAAMNVLVLAGNVSQVEFPVLETFTSAGGEKLNYTETSDKSLPGLQNADILWLGQGEICENGYLFDVATENKIKSFVKSGGIVISVGQDSDPGDPCAVGWITAPIVGMESPNMTAFEIINVPEAGDLFKEPNEIEAAEFDDAWAEPDDAYIILATVNNGQEVGIALLNHGLGYYVVTSIENETADQAVTNTPIMENLIHYAVYLKSTIAVEYRGKLSMTWGAIKGEY